MNKKTLIIAFTIFLIIPLFSNQVCAQDTSDEGLLDDIRLLYFETETNLTIKETTIPEELLNPGDEFTIKAKVEFKFILDELFPEFLLGTKIGNWIIFRDTNFDMSVNLSLDVEEKPDLFDIEYPKEITIEEIGTEVKDIEVEFHVTVNKSVSALREDTIKIEASFEPETAWGLEESTASDSFTIKSNYVGFLNASFNLPDDYYKIRFKGGETKTIELKIFNYYNGESIIEIKPTTIILNETDWNISIGQKSITLGPGENGTVLVNFTVKKSDSITAFTSSYAAPILILTPVASGNSDIVGKKQFRVNSPEVILDHEGSLTEILIMIIIAVIIAIVIIVVIILVLKRLNR